MTTSSFLEMKRNITQNALLYIGQVDKNLVLNERILPKSTENNTQYRCKQKI